MLKSLAIFLFICQLLNLQIVHKSVYFGNGLICFQLCAAFEHTTNS